MPSCFVPWLTGGTKRFAGRGKFVKKYLEFCNRYNFGSSQLKNATDAVLDLSAIVKFEKDTLIEFSELFN